MRVLYSVIILLVMAIPSYTQTVWTGGFDSDWSNDLNWTANAPTTGMTATILASPNDPVISADLNVDFIIQNFATITFDADVVNNGTIINFGAGKIISNENFTNSVGQNFQNDGILENNGLLVNEGVLVGSGMGTIKNNASASFQNQSSALVQNFAMIDNNGSFINDGQILNFDAFDNYAQVVNNGTFTQGADGIFNNYGTATVENNGIILNSGDIINETGGHIVNTNQLTNNSDGQIINDGDINNLATLINSGQFTNTATLINEGVMTNDFGADLHNTGTVMNNSCATFRQFTAHPIAGDFINNGILYIIPGAGNVNVTAGTGILLDDINDLPLPNAQCKNITISLNADGEAWIDVSDVDNGSSVGYCTIANIEINISDFDCEDVGPNIVLLTIEDDLGRSNFCSSTVTVLDDEAPVITNCPDDIEVDLASGECDAVATWSNPSAMDNCNFTLVRTDDSGLYSGDAFPIGMTTIEYTADDGSNTTICSFEISINEFVPPQQVMGCLGGIVHMTVDDNCQTEVLPNDLLVGFHYHCFEDYDVHLFYDQAMTDPVPTSPVLTSADIGRVITVVVDDTEADISCWGRVRPEDKTDPEITCENHTITCFEDYSPAALGYPASWDNCDNGLYPTFEDQVTNINCHETEGNITKIITRNWTVSDFSGNSNSCVQTITVERPDFSTLAFPPNLDGIDNPALSCAADPSLDPLHTGYPTILGYMIDNDECQFSSVYEDTHIPICDGTYKIYREWIVIDWCSNAMHTGQQIIKVKDDTGPVLTCPENEIISTNLNSCTGTFYLSDIGITDACSNNFTTSVTASAGTLVGNAIVHLPLGTTLVTYYVEDGCHNPATCTFSIEVRDEVPPIPVCETFHTISLTIDQPTLVNAIVFDDGSTDNCSELTYDVRRMDTNHCDGWDGTFFGDKVPFYCCDVNNTVMVELRIKDASNNTNSCMVEVQVQDKLDPIITCPPKAFLDCYDDVTDLSLTNGAATAYDNCGAEIDFEDDGGVDNCGGGTIIRTWIATDPGGRTATCNQSIIVANSTPFYITDTNCYNSNPNDGVIWPCDFENDICASLTDPSTTGEPVIIEDGCDLVSVTYQDTELPIIDDACFKVIRTWKVVDWCQHDHETGAGEWTYNQLIKILNTEAPEFTSDCTDQSFCSYDPSCWEGHAELIATASDDCTPETDLRFNYEIDLNKNGSIDYSGETANASGDYPLGHHRISWRVEDGCGNYRLCAFDFVISDCKKPTVYCKNGIAVELMPHNSEVEVWATDINHGSYDNCGIEEFRIASPSGGPGQNVPPTSNNVTFDCDDIGTRSVDMWVKDVNGNWDYCSSYIIIQDNNGSCDGQSGDDAMIAGNIQNEAGDMVESVMVYIEGTAPGIPDPNMTNTEGTYSFPELPMGFEYQVAPAKNDDPLNGVSTFDLVLIKKHILGLQYFNSPYKIIASDINNNGSVSTFDLVLLRKLILQIDDAFTHNTSWRFVDADFVFPNPANPWETPFPEVYDINYLNQDMNGDFVAVKIGDVNGNAQTNGFTGSGDDRNMDDPMIFTAKDEALNPGRTYQLDFRAADINNIYGYQFTLNFDRDRLKFINIIPGALTGLDLSNFGFTKLLEGSITTSWDREVDISAIDEEAILFSLVFEAKASTVWSESVAIASKYTRAEAYHIEHELLNVELAFEQLASQANRFKIYPNQPNPFMDETLISCSLPESTPLNFTIQNVAGQIVHSQEFDANAGYNEILISRSMLEGPGVYFYTIKTKTHRVSQRMVLIRE